MFVEIALFGALIFLLYQFNKKPKHLPPGPWGLPIVGDLSSGGSFTPEYISEMVAKYGDIFSVRVGSMFAVFLADFDTIKTTFSRPEMQGRPKIYTFLAFAYHKNIGIVGSDGEPWVHGRRFALRQLRDLGLGKTRIQSSIQIEAEELIKFLEDTKESPTELTFELNVAVLNVIWQLVASKRYDVHDKRILHFIKLLNRSLELVQGPIGYLDVFPWLLKILPKPLMDTIFQTNEIDYHVEELGGFVKECIEDHVKNLDPDSPQDYIDHYLVEMEKEKDNPHSTFRSDYLDLIISIEDLFAAGSETTSSSLRWFVLLIAKYPEEQKKIQRMIDEVVSRDRLPSLEDRNDLTYLDAAILETLRFSSFLPQGLPHRVTEDSKIGEYFIPKDTMIVPCHGYTQRSSKYFEKPDEFYPQHFLGENNELLTKKQGFGPFSLGRRQCLGESLAKAELFLFSAAILQKFNIVAPPGEPLDTSYDETKPEFLVVKPYKVCFVKRE